MKPATLTAGYVCLYPALCEIARRHGYALAAHGTMQRDFDLVAVPWTEAAVDALTLILAIKTHVRANTHHFEADEYFPDCNPTRKPHGRLAYSLHFTNRGGEGPYLDVSVMPRATGRDVDLFP